MTWCSQCAPLSVGSLHLQRPSLYLVPGVVNIPFLFFSQYCDFCPLWNIVPYRTCAMESSTVSREKMKKPAHVCKIYDGTSNSQNLSLKLEIHDSLHHLHFITYRIILLFKQVFVAADSFDAGTAFAWSSPGDKNQDPSTCT